MQVGSIYSAEHCPVCAAEGKKQTFEHKENDGLYCPAHPFMSPKASYIVRYTRKLTARFKDYRQAYNYLLYLRVKDQAGELDLRAHLIKKNPLAFDKLAEEWLDLKATQIKITSLRSIASGLRRAIKAWGNTCIKDIQFAQIQDFLKNYDGAPKSKANALAALKQFWEWVVDRYDIPPLKKWPKIGYVEMAFRETIDLATQAAIIEDIQRHEPFKVWLCIKWLGTYIAIRPGEMRNITEGQVDRQRGVLIIPHPKEKRAKLVPLTSEDTELVRQYDQSNPRPFDQATPFFRHEGGIGGTRPGEGFGHSMLYRAWGRACKRLGVSGVPLYPGTKHSTAMGLRAIYTPEQIKAQTLHSTSAAFNRYFQTSGEDLRQLYEGQKKVTSPEKLLKNISGAGDYYQPIEFSKK